MPNGRLIEWVDAQLTERNRKATAVAVESGLDRSIVSKWRKGQEAKADDVRRFALALGAPVIDAFLAAGFLRLQDTGAREVARPVSALGDEELIAEIRRRMKGARNGVEGKAQPPTSTAGHQGKKIEELPGEAHGDDIPLDSGDFTPPDDDAVEDGEDGKSLG